MRHHDSLGRQAKPGLVARPRTPVPGQNVGHAPPGGFDRSGSAIGNAIRQALAAYRGQPVAGILLVSDGQATAASVRTACTTETASLCS